MRREIADLVFCFKAINGQVQIPSDLFAWFVTGRCLRTTDDLKLAVPFARTDVFKHSYFVRITRLWNSLPYTVRSLESLPSFRRELFKLYYDRFHIDWNP